MAKLNAKALNDLSDRLHGEIVQNDKPVITVHMGTCGIASGAQEVLDCVKEEIKTRKSHIIVKTSGCAGLCSREPMMTVSIPGKPPVKYADLNPKKVVQIMEQHIETGSPVTKYALAIGSERTY